MGASASDFTVILQQPPQGWMDYATAYGSLIAVVIAVLVAGREAAAARRDRRESQDARQRVQAESVSSWIERDEDPSKPLGFRATAHVCNDSTQPIYGVIVVDEHRMNRNEDSEWLLVDYDVVPPERTLVTDVTDAVVGPKTARAAIVATSVLFSDAAGRPWQRHETGVVRFRAESSLELRHMPKAVRRSHMLYRWRTRTLRAWRRVTSRLPLRTPQKS